MDRPVVQVAVVMEREAQPNRWEDWRHRVAEVVPNEGVFGDEPRMLREDGRVSHLAAPGLRAAVCTPTRPRATTSTSRRGAGVVRDVARRRGRSVARAPEAVSLSYNEAGRWLDAQERVDNVPLDAEMCAWLQAFTDEHYRPEPKQRKRPASFVTPKQRQ